MCDKGEAVTVCV